MLEVTKLKAKLHQRFLLKRKDLHIGKRNPYCALFYFKIAAQNPQTQIKVENKAKLVTCSVTLMNGAEKNFFASIDAK